MSTLTRFFALSVFAAGVIGCASQTESSAGTVAATKSDTVLGIHADSETRPSAVSAPMAVALEHTPAAPGSSLNAGESDSGQNGSADARAYYASSLASNVARRSVVRKATLAVRVADLEKADHALDAETVTFGGYVDAESSTDLSSENPQMDVTVRVPVEKFDTALAKFEALGTELSKGVSSEDVTGQIVDLDARMRTLGAEEETYRNILRRASAIKDVIALQDKLTEVRSQLESMASERKTLGSLSALSTITVHLERSADVIRPPVDSTWLGQAWGESTTRLGSVMRSAAVGGIWALVFCPFLIPFAFLIRWSSRRARARRVAVREEMAREI